MHVSIARQGDGPWKLPKIAVMFMFKFSKEVPARKIKQGAVATAISNEHEEYNHCYIKCLKLG